LKMKTKNVSCHAADSKPVTQEVNSTVILPPLVFTGLGFEPRIVDAVSDHLKLRELLLCQFYLARFVRVERVCQIGVTQTAQILVVEKLALAVVVGATRLVNDDAAVV